MRASRLNAFAGKLLTVVENENPIYIAFSIEEFSSMRRDSLAAGVSVGSSFTRMQAPWILVG
jgi:hypothetical protein